MRKLKLFAVLAGLLMISGASFAQQGTMYVGTSGLNFWNTGNALGQARIANRFMTGFVAGDNQTSFGLSPEVGYFITDKWALGLSIGFQYDDFEVLTVSTSQTTFGINPYVRYYFMKWDKLSLYAQGGFAYQTTAIENIDDNVNYFEINVRPGIAYSLNDHFGINATFGILGYSDYDGSSEFGLNLNANALSFGLSYSF